MADACDEGFHALDIAAALARAVAARTGLAVDDAAAPELVRRIGGPAVVDELDVGPGSLGIAYEQALDAGHRHSMGVHYTPPLVARRLAEVALDAAAGEPLVCDPSVGGGAFLLGAAEVLEARGLDRTAIVRHHLWGVDVDQGAVQVADAALALWGSVDGEWVRADAHLVVGDTLTMGASAFGPRDDGFQVVLGNPPFQGQLSADTARSAAHGRRLRDRWDVATGPYADTAGFFLLAGLELADADGVVVLVQPQSILVTGDAAPIRAAVLQRAALQGLWTADTGVFDASVRVCAPMLRRGAVAGPVQRWTGASLTDAGTVAAPTDSGGWSGLIADLQGVPAVAGPFGPSLACSCAATAGFRDQFYGLAAHTVEGGVPTPTRPALVTVGMIDPLRLRWGGEEFRFAKRRWREPRVDLEAVDADDPVLAAWVRDRLAPKLLVATQTKVIEVVVDQPGELVPSTPVIAVSPPPERLWHVAAALTSPVTSALAFQRAAGAALSADTLKLSARQVLELPLPVDEAAWDEGARLAELASTTSDADEWHARLESLADVMTAAYGLVGADAQEVIAWWRGRRPAWR